MRDLSREAAPKGGKIYCRRLMRSLIHWTTGPTCALLMDCWNDGCGGCWLQIVRPKSSSACTSIASTQSTNRRWLVRLINIKRRRLRAVTYTVLYTLKLGSPVTYYY